MKTADQMFEEKMAMIEKETGIHPELRFLMMAGPNDSKTIMKIMKAIYICGIDDAKAGKVI